MKILFIYTDEEMAKADAARSHFTEKDFIIENFPLLPPEKAAGSFELQLASYFALSVFDDEDLAQTIIPSQSLIVSPLSGRCFDFLAGFSCASRLPFPVFGEAAIAAIPEEFSACFKPIKTQADLLGYFKTENEAYKKGEYERETSKIREKLLNMGVPINVDSLVRCVTEGCLQEVTLFLAAGFSPDTLNYAGVPLLSIAARKGKQEITRYLMQAGAQIDLLSHDRGSSALIDSITGCHYAIANDLVKAGADVNVQNKDGQSALIIAIGNCDPEIVEVLLKAGADPDSPDKLGVSARKYAMLFHNEVILTLLDTYAL